MRELNECTAEVFRRSEKRIRERRRKRGRVLAVCIPVCLIAVAWSAKGLLPAAPDRDTSDYAQMVDYAEMSVPCPYTAVEIQDAGVFPEEHYGKVTQQETVAEMFHAVRSLFADTDGAGQDASGGFPASEASPADMDNANQNLIEPTGKRRDCTITFTAEDGSQAVYHLSGNTLVNVSTNETVFLSDAQIAGLTAVLGISE